MEKYDIVIIGAGIIGVATAKELQRRYPARKILLIEKEAKPAMHQTGRNSGVIHAGVYYQPGSLKAKFCRQGLEQTIAYCQKQTIAYHQCGKLIVATNRLEQSRLVELFKRCEMNDLQPILLSKQQLRQSSPNTLGEEAILVRQTGIVDYAKVTQALLQEFNALGGRTIFGCHCQHVEHNSNTVILKTANININAKFVVNCSGVMSDRVIENFGLKPDFRIVPFKGEYYKLPKAFDSVIEHLIYPVPDPSLPFLGIHLTKMIDGCVTVGPNAVLAFDREGYGKLNFNFKDTISTLGFSGFWRLLNHHKRSVFDEAKSSLVKSAYLKQVQKYCPAIGLADLLPYRSGIRAQAVGSDGSLIHDFKFMSTQTSLHVCNAPSPAATSALPIANEIANRVQNILS